MIVGIDLGGTTAKFGLYDEKTMRIVEHSVLETKKLYGEQVIKALYDHYVSWLAAINTRDEHIETIGLACVGPVDEKTDVIKDARFGWIDFPVSKIAKKYFKKTVYLVNDARAAIIGEKWRGAGRKLNNFLMYTLGTGVGGGIVINKQVFVGSHNYANEVGHGGKMQDSLVCRCGLSGCIEPMSSATGIEQIFQSYIKEHPSSSIAKLQLKTKNKLTVKNVVPLIKKNDFDAILCLEKALFPLASHIAVMIHSLDPDAVIIGGGPSALGQPLLDIITKIVRKYTLPFTHELVKIVLAKLGNQAGVYGAIFVAARKYNDYITKTKLHSVDESPNVNNDALKNKILRCN